jgi:hypothetical protein
LSTRFKNIQGCRDTIPSVLKKNGLTKLAALVTEAGLADTLSGPGKFITIKIPTQHIIH